MAKMKSNKIIDAHAHVLPRFLPDEMIGEIALEAKENETLVINVTPTIDCQEEANEISKQYPWLLPTAGFHGLFTSEYNDGDNGEVEQLMTDKTVAIGPVGLHFHEYTTEEEKRQQMSIIVSQVRLARKHYMPVILHIRYSLEKNVEIIKKFPDVNFILLGWFGDGKETKKLLKETNKNVWFIFGGRITHTKKEDSAIPREILKAIPRNRILIGSGSPSPDVIPQTLIKKEKISKPWFVRETAKWMAKSLKVGLENFIKKCNENAIEVYKLDPKILDEDTTIFDYTPPEEDEQEKRK